MKQFVLDYKSYHYEIYVFLYGMLQSEEEAKELLQDTFVAFLQELRKCSMPIEKKRRWLYKVSKNKALNCLKRQKTWYHLEKTKLGSDCSTEQRKVGYESAIYIKCLMGKMKEREALILQLYSSGLNYEEMADVMEIGVASVSKTLGRAKLSFKKLYEEEDSELLSFY